MTFSSGEMKLPEWLEENAFVAWCPHPAPWLLEEHMISTLSLPLNLDQNRRHAVRNSRKPGGPPKPSHGNCRLFANKSIDTDILLTGFAIRYQYR
jgi:hypothetical protein